MSKMNSNLSPRPKKRKQQDDMKEQIIAQVHKPVISNTSSDNDYGSIQSANSEDNVESNRTYTKNEDAKIDRTYTKNDIMALSKYEDKNENISMHTPSREISVDGETQINSKILSLIETEMQRSINKHSHFTDSRPQSLSFYEDEKVPEELSGNLELLSPEERKHYKKRKEYITQMDTEEMNAYNSLQDAHGGRDPPEDIMTSSMKKSKSKKKRHGGDGDLGMGDSREMMIPKEKKKSKKKKRDTSPAASNNTKRKHKKREDADYDLRTEIAVALEELQDDVFDNSPELAGGAKTDKMKNKSPRKSDKLYIQKKNKFEVSTKPTVNQYLNRQGAQDIIEDGKFGKRCSIYPLEVAIIFQRWWMRLSTLCHGLLGGLALGHWLYLVCNFHQQDSSFLLHYAYYSDIYVGLFFALCVLCIVSVFDRIDIAHLEKNYTKELWKQKRSSFVVIVYVSCLIVHLSTANFDDKLSLMSYRRNGNNTLLTNMTRSELRTWNHLSLWRALLAFTAWIFVGLGPPEDMLYHHLKNLEAYLPNK